MTSGSGNGWAVKNDVRTDDISLEYKYTDAKSFPLKYEDLKKAETNALLDSGREFGFVVGFARPHGSVTKVEREYVVVSREYFESLVSRGTTE